MNKFDFMPSFTPALIVAKNFLIMALFIISAVSLAGIGQAKVISICSDGCNYTNITAGIVAANPSDTIDVQSGTYLESINVTKPIILNGVNTGKGIPVVDARTNGSAITLSADGIVLKGLHAIKSSDDELNIFGGIKVASDNNTLIDNIVSDNRNGILVTASSNNYIVGNNVKNNKYGIKLIYSDGNIISNNSIYNNIISGISLNSSRNNIIEKNNVMKNDNYSIDLLYSDFNILLSNNASYNYNGLSINYSNNNNIVNNEINSNRRNGIFLLNSSNDTILMNRFNNNTVGEWLRFSSLNDIIGNSISDNDFGVWLKFSNNNNVLENIISNNSYGIFSDYSYNNAFDNDVLSNYMNYTEPSPGIGYEPPGSGFGPSLVQSAGSGASKAGSIKGTNQKTSHVKSNKPSQISKGSSTVSTQKT
jgi:nitrous oxidase accessory protein